ncbi:PLP-dependent aminotransferase family protein [Cesiribacter sp. SM1]|uniref:aminotransferase-like domain-containing protein n=1 Tax=Cesiribacter sp. SM1 TaxID=2861196 RepID=UPI001CD66C8E|nr:PLP-dependent aminotransferase family protein [Cesiribacter sp. SM1]
MDYPYLNLLEIDKEKSGAVYLQISQGLASLIQQGVLKPGQKLPGTRLLAEILRLNRNTITLAMDELQAEGWVVAKERSGLYVNGRLPVVTVAEKDPLKEESLFTADVAGATAFRLEQNLLLEAPEVHKCALEFNDGFPDPRLSPLQELGREYRRLHKKANPLKLFSYSDAQGDPFFRNMVCRQLNEIRGFAVAPADIFISRGSVMGIYLLARTTLKPGDTVVIGELNYRTANLCFEQCGARLVRIPVDSKGLDTHALEALLQQQPIRMLYITSHHQHPTTVMLAPERRLHLYELARKYKFYILEDDYDFDYHYENKPTLPIASMDRHGLVIYTGSYSKVIYPTIRVGFVVAPPALIMEMVKYRRIIDRQGDHLIERALANLIQEGTLQRYLRKSKNIYKKRKEHFCQLLRQEFSQYLYFQEPEGGMAVWVKFREAYPLVKVAEACKARNLYLSNGLSYNPPGKQLNACRMGFAGMTEQEMRQACTILKEVLEEMAPRYKAC